MTNWQWTVILSLIRIVLAVSASSYLVPERLDSDLNLLREALARGEQDDI